MSGNDGNGGGNRTVFRPSPLQGLGQGNQQGNQQGGQSPFGGPPPAATIRPSPFGSQSAPYAPQQPAPPVRMANDDIPLPAQPQSTRNRLMLEAGPILALAASVKSGRARLPMVNLHGQATAAIAAFDRAIAGQYPDETRQRAKYALASTLDDIAQNLPGSGNDAAEWARRSMVVQTFQENIGGDRFWQLVDEMLARPAQNMDLIELFHACLACGFEGRFRVMPDGKRRLHEIMTQLYGAMEHPRSLSMMELVTHWRGEKAPLRKVGFMSYIALAGAIAAGVLLVLYILFRLFLMQSGYASWDAMTALNPEQRLTLSRAGGAAPEVPAGVQSGRLKEFLAPEISQGLVVVEEDSATVRVRTTVGQLFQSGSDTLESGRQSLFEKIGKAIETEKGYVHVEGHSDSDRIASLAFPDNMALSGARANVVAQIIANQLSDAARVEAKALGDGRPIGSNKTAEGKSLNRRVEIVIPRQN
jgi:type VI secretion system protein ImpK